jgi:hypothetical protein
MMTIYAKAPIRGVCDKPGEVRVENSKGSGLVACGVATYISHTDDEVPRATIKESRRARKKRDSESDT